MFKKPGNVVNSNPNDFESSWIYSRQIFWNIVVKRLPFSPSLASDIALKNKMYNTIKLETEDERVNQSTQD